MKIFAKMKRLDKVPLRYRKQVETRLRRLPRVIRDRRETLGYTQEELSEGLDISIETMKAIEGGRRIPSLPMLLYICLYLDIDLRFDYR
jgi:DNA-binding XRE family transcriptional regulator